MSEIEEKKKYLNGYIYATRKARRLNEQIEELRSQKMFPSFQADGMPRGSGISDLSGYAARLDELIALLETEKETAVQKYEEIYNQVQLMENEAEKEVLERKYLLGDTWWRIALKMNYDKSHIYRIHGTALLHFQMPENLRANESK